MKAKEYMPMSERFVCSVLGVDYFEFKDKNWTD